VVGQAVMIAGAIAKSEDLIKEGRRMIVNGVFPFYEEEKKRKDKEETQDRVQRMKDWVEQGAVLVQQDERFMRRKKRRRQSPAVKAKGKVNQWKPIS
jgi:hypothetical protein